MSARPARLVSGVALALSCWGFAAPAHAQLSAGGGIAGVQLYDIVATDGSGAWLGQVLVVAGGAKSPPKGAVPGTEDWRFDTTTLPASFALEPVPLTAEVTGWSPALSFVSDHLQFDQDDVFLAPTLWAKGTTYAASRVSCASCTGAPEAWFDLDASGAQQAWADAADVWTETLELGSGEVLRFDAAPLPKAGSVKLVEAR